MDSVTTVDCRDPGICCCNHAGGTSAKESAALVDPWQADKVYRACHRKRTGKPPGVGRRSELACLDASANPEAIPMSRFWPLCTSPPPSLIIAKRLMSQTLLLHV